MNFSQLRFVKAAAELSSFSRAAEVCHVTQPTLSNGISKLEQELGEKIFQRTTRNVDLTSFGEHLLPTLLSILRLEEAAYTTAKQFTSPDMVVIQMGMSPLVNPHIVSMLTTSFHEQNPRYQIVFVEDNLDVLEEKLMTNAVDIILVPKVKRVGKRQKLPLYDEALYLIEQQASVSKKVELNTIRNRTFVMVPDSCGLSEITRILIQATGQTIKEYQGKAMSYQVLADWASHGLGAAILPKSKIPEENVKQLVINNAEPISISFEAQWLDKDNARLEPLIKHFEENIVSISNGLL